MKYIIAGVLIAFATLAGFLLWNRNHRQDLLTQSGLAGLSTEEMVDRLEASLDEPSILKASINATDLILNLQGDTMTFPLSKDLFYLSVAPYVQQTHLCGNHNLITCRGELKSQTFLVEVRNEEGILIVSQEMTSHDNGFIGIWLPRDLNGTLTITQNGLSATTDLRTSVTSNTCQTTLELV
jgi:hypothetical protein